MYTCKIPLLPLVSSCLSSFTHFLTCSLSVSQSYLAYTRCALTVVAFMLTLLTASTFSLFFIFCAFLYILCYGKLACIRTRSRSFGDLIYLPSHDPKYSRIVAHNNNTRNYESDYEERGFRRATWFVFGNGARAQLSIPFVFTCESLKYHVVVHKLIS